MQDATLSIESLAVTVASSFRVKALSELELSPGRDVALVFEHNDLVLIQSVLDDFEVGI